MTSHYLYEWWLYHRCIYASLGPNELNRCNSADSNGIVVSFTSTHQYILGTYDMLFWIYPEYIHYLLQKWHRSSMLAIKLSLLCPSCTHQLIYAFSLSRCYANASAHKLYLQGPVLLSTIHVQIDARKKKNLQPWLLIGWRLAASLSEARITNSC